MAQINPHINFNGNAAAAFAFYQSVFGGSFSKIVYFKEIASATFPVPESELDKIMHIALPIGSTALMGNDVPEFMGKVNELEHRSKIVVQEESREEAIQLYTGLSQEGTIEVPMDIHGDVLFGMFRDRFGIEWIIEVAS